MAQDNSVQLPTRAPNSLRSKTLGRLSILSGKQNKTPNNESTLKTQSLSRAFTGPPSPTPSPSASLKTIPRPNLTWEPGMFTLDYIQRNLPLPRVVLCDHSLCDKGRGTRGFDCGQLLMLRTRNEMLRVQAGSLAVNVKDNKTLVETEDRLVVPEDYKGWFAVLGRSMTLKAIPHYRQMAQLAQSDCSMFLISGTENVRSMKKMGESLSESRPLCPGDILKMGTLDETERYLHCTDDNDRDVLIPVESQGTFYVLKNKSTPNKVPILQIKDILQKCQFPCVVKLVYGREPTGEGVFTKMMVLEGVKQEMSLLASTILKSRNTLHDLPLDIPNKFKVAVQSKELVHNIGYISALNLCQDTGDLFVRSIKLFRHIPGQTPVEPKVSAMGIAFAPKASSESKPPAKKAQSTPTPKPAPVKQQAAVSAPKTPVVKASQDSTPKAQTIQSSPQAPKPVAANSQTTKKQPPVTTSELDKKHIVSETTIPSRTTEKLPLATTAKAQLAPIKKQAETPTIIPVVTKAEVKAEEQTQKLKPTETTTIHVNGSTKHDSKAQSQVNGEPNLHRQRPPETDVPPAAPMVTAIFVKGGVPPRPVNTKDHSQNEEKAQNGDTKTERPPVQVVHLVRPETRPGAYEEVWTASSGKEDSANEELSSTSSSMSDFQTFGIGGQVVTGGVPEAPGKRSPSPPPPPPPTPPPPTPPPATASTRTSSPLPTPPPPLSATSLSPPVNFATPTPSSAMSPPPPPHLESQPPPRPKLQTTQPQVPTQKSPKPSPQPQAMPTQPFKSTPQQSPKQSPQPLSKPTSPFQFTQQHPIKQSPHTKPTSPFQSTQPTLKTEQPNPTVQTQVPQPKVQPQIISEVPKPKPKPQLIPQRIPQSQPEQQPKSNMPASPSHRNSELPPIPTQSQPQPKVQTINVMTSNEKKIHAKSLLSHYSTIDIVDGVPDISEKIPPNSKASRRESVYSEIDVVDDIPVIEGGSSSETDAEDFKASRKKKVSFSDILDVQTIPKQSVTSIDSHEDDDDLLDNEYSDTRPKSDFSLDGWEIYTGRPSGQREVTPNFGEFNMAQRSYTSSGYGDDAGYMMPVIDRKGRVKTQGHRGQAEPHHGDLAKRLSLPNMRVVKTREPSREYSRRDSEDDILW